MTLAVIMAAYNERPTIEAILKRVCAQTLVSQLIVIDDGSTDGTREYLEEAARAEPRIQLFLHEKNEGKGAAIRRGISAARAPITIIQDADLEYDPADFAAVIRPILERETKVSYGSRVLCKDNAYPLDWFRFGSFVVTWATNLLYGCRLTDEPCCYKAFDTEFLQSLPLRARGFEFCPEVTAWTRKRGQRIIEVPVRYYRRTIEEGKKIRWTDGVHALWTLLRLRFARG
jgi:glycosyltransferase involved in cell wall biosynthesis